MHDSFTFFVPYLTTPITWWVFLFGLCIGSFLNVCIIRIPEQTFWRDLRSVCPSCKQVIPAWLNIPVLSWLLLKGRSACCQTRLSIQYPLVELFTGALFILIYWKFPIMTQSSDRIILDSASTIRFFHAAVFCCLLTICSVIDIREMIIPDAISLPMVMITPLVVYLHPDLNLSSALWGVLAGGGFLYTLGVVYYLIRREVGMGLGDVKLLAAIGGWLGYQALIPTLLIASISGAFFGIAAIIVTRSQTLKVKVPFGPFLAIGAVAYLLLGSEINRVLFYR